MSGRRPFSDLAKRFTPEQWRYTKEGAAKMNAEIEANEAAANQPNPKGRAKQATTPCGGSDEQPLEKDALPRAGSGQPA